MDFKGLMFSFAHGSHRSHGFLLLRSFFLWSLVSTVAYNEEDLWDPCETSLSESQCKDTTFHFPNSPMLIVAHRLSLINIRVLPNGRKYRILAEDWTPCSSCCIHSSAAAHRAGCILLSISSDGLLPRPGRNPENRAGLTPAWCNFVNPLTVIIMLNVKCWTRISRISRIFRSQATYSFNSFNSCSEKTIRNSCSVKTVRNSRAEKYLLGLCFVNIILSHRNHDT